jgi:hypothetical protein
MGKDRSREGKSPSQKKASHVEDVDLRIRIQDSVGCFWGELYEL